jgi:hypothetical protein
MAGASQHEFIVRGTNSPGENDCFPEKIFSLADQGEKKPLLNRSIR